MQLQPKTTRQPARSFRPTPPERLLFCIIFNPTHPRSYNTNTTSPIAFRAGSPFAPRTTASALAHCGGNEFDRDKSPYISCSRDLLWCLWLGIKSLLHSKVRKSEEATIFFLTDGPEYVEWQTDISSEEFWDEVSNTEEEALESLRWKVFNRARKRSRSASKVLVHKEVPRERILGFLTLNEKFIRDAELEWIYVIDEGGWYSNYETCLGDHEIYLKFGRLAMWCEMKLRKVNLKESEGCLLRGISKGLLTKFKAVITDVEEDEGTPFQLFLDGFYLPWLEFLECHEEEHHVREHSNQLA